MKHYYLLIDAPGELSTDSHFFKVAIGQSAQEQRYLVHIEAYARANNCFFNLCDNPTAEFLNRIAESLEVPVYLLGVQFVTAKQMFQHIKLYGTTPAKPTLTHQEAEAISLYNSNFFFYRKNHVLLHAEAEKRNKPKVRCVGMPG